MYNINMASFFEKLKKGMGVEETEGVEELEEVEKKPAKKANRRKTPILQTKKTKIKKAQPEPEEEPEPEETPAVGVKKLGIKPVFADEDSEPETVEVSPRQNEEKEEEGKERWFEPEGQLAIDIYQTETDLVIQSAIAGVKPDSLDITMEKDVITIRGSREKPFEESGDFFTQECFWGPFSREIILPAEIDPNKARAEMKEGILTIRIPKMLRERKRKIVIS